MIRHAHRAGVDGPINWRAVSRVGAVVRGEDGKAIQAPAGYVESGFPGTCPDVPENLPTLREAGIDTEAA